jgi:hypothetical protein
MFFAYNSLKITTLAAKIQIVKNMLNVKVSIKFSITHKRIKMCA